MLPSFYGERPLMFGFAGSSIVPAPTPVTSAWESMELAGNPPPPEQVPVDLVDGTKQ